MRKAMDLSQYEYDSKEEYEQHAQDMKEKGWRVVGNNMGVIGKILEPHEVEGETWKYSASFYKVNKR